jgi:hypothetical protein
VSAPIIAAAQVPEHRGHVAPGEVGPAAVVDAVATGELRHVDLGELEIAADRMSQRSSVALVPGAWLAGDHAIGANARDRHRQRHAAVDRAIEIGVPRDLNEVPYRRRRPGWTSSSSSVAVFWQARLGVNVLLLVDRRDRLSGESPGVT